MLVESGVPLSSAGCQGEAEPFPIADAARAERGAGGASRDLSLVAC